LMVFRRAMLSKVGEFQYGYEGSQDWDLFMRLVESTEPDRICHIPSVLYHWRVISGSTALSANQKDTIIKAQRKTLNSHLDRTGIMGELQQTKEGYWRVRLGLPSPQPKVSILIPTKDKVELLRQCIESIYKLSTYKNFEILVIDNCSEQDVSIKYFDALVSSGQANVITYDKAFNYPAINNYAVNHADGQLLLLLNNDIEVITPDWLEEMVSLAIRPDTGAVGAKLYYPDGRIQHAGVILGIGGVAGHVYQFLDRTHTGQMGRAMLRQNLSAVTGACLMIEKQKYVQVGGLNDKDLKVGLNDIDFCIRLLKAGYRNVWTPFAELYHCESASRGYEDTPEKQERFSSELEYMVNTWAETLSFDPAFNPNISLDNQDLGLAFPPRKRE
jgi:GT2 family glycosyltransferase